jgi:hypothetical protein
LGKIFFILEVAKLSDKSHLKFYFPSSTFKLVPCTWWAIQSVLNSFCSYQGIVMLAGRRLIAYYSLFSRVLNLSIQDG